MENSYLDTVKLNLFFNIYLLNYEKCLNDALIKKMEHYKTYPIVNELITMISNSGNISFTEFYNFYLLLKQSDDIHILKTANICIEQTLFLERNLLNIVYFSYEELFQLFLEKINLMDILYELNIEDETENRVEKNPQQEIEETQEVSEIEDIEEYTKEIEDIIIKDEKKTIDELCMSFYDNVYMILILSYLLTIILNLIFRN
jgi:hypothetical protein